MDRCWAAPAILSHGKRAVSETIQQGSYGVGSRQCHALIGGVVAVSFDSHYLTRTYSRSLARYLAHDMA